MVTSGAVVALIAALQVQQPCIASPPQVVDDIYQQVLERPADPGSAGFSQALGSGELTVREIVIRVAQSPEHLNRFFWRPLVNDVYRQSLRRPPSAEEQQAAMRQLAGGMPVRGFIARTAVTTAQNEAQAVEILYQQLLGHEPDPEALRAHVALAQQGGLDAVMRSIMSTQEYRQRAQRPAGEELAAYSTGVQLLFRHLLNRAPNPDEFQAMAQLAAIYSLAEVAQRIGSSREYLQRWGEHGVPGASGIRFCGAEREGAQPRRLPGRRFPSN
jgi:hypothetical protein